jgi:branched-chain amino acid transport system substrate-binding protein
MASDKALRRGAQARLPWRPVHVWLALAAALTVALAACSSAASSSAAGGSAAGGSAAGGSPITICVVFALSGQSALPGGGPPNGVKAYVKMVNATGGMDGHPVKVVEEDDQSTPANAALAARKCVTQDHANFVFGPENSGTAVAAIPVLNSLKTVSIGFESGWKSLGLAAADQHSYFFPGNFNAFHEFDLAMIQEIVVKNHLTRVGVLESSSPSGLGNDTYLESIASQYGFQVVGVQKVSTTTTDDTPAVLALLATKPQAIVAALTPGTPTITGIKAVRAQDASIPIGLCVACDNDDFIAAVGGAAQMSDVYIDGSLSYLLANMPDTPANKTTIADLKNFVKSMTAAGYGTVEDLSDGAPGWQAAEELDNAITRAHSVSPADVQKALQTQQLDTLGVVWARTPQNYGAIKSVATGVDTIGASGKPQFVGVTAGGPGE